MSQRLKEKPEREKAETKQGGGGRSVEGSGRRRGSRRGFKEGHRQMKRL